MAKAKTGHSVRNEEAPAYVVPPHQDAAGDDDLIQKALAVLAARMKAGPMMGSPGDVRDYLRLKIGGLEHEEFHIVWLDAQHRVIEIEGMFRGTLTQTSVYPREVVKAALRHNAGAAILAHNHPSGMAEPSRADEALTHALKGALAIVDVRVIDHIVVGVSSTVSFAERGLL